MSEFDLAFKRHQALPAHIRNVCHTSVDDARTSIRNLDGRRAQECLDYLGAGNGNQSASLVKMLERRLRVLSKGATR